MSRQLQFLAADLGAESGRVMRGGFDGARISLEEVHRFDSRAVRLPDGLHTNALQILSEVEAGIAAAARSGVGELAGVAVDTWGVDFALLDARGALLGPPFHYRDRLSDGMLARALQQVSREEIFERTGIGFMEINTLYQLLGLKARGAAALESAHSLLMMADLFTYWLCGRRCNELTIATTSQCLDTRRRSWALDIVERLSLPTRIFGEIVEPGTVLGELLPHVAEEAGVPRLPVIAAGGHDTALAMAAVPARERDFAYLSSGTWSLLGTELGEPCIGAPSLAANFTNEGGVRGTTRFLKNLCGLWIVQECRRAWARRGPPDSYEDLARMASAAPPLRSLIDVDHPDFAKPTDMPARIRAYCRRTGQPVPEGKGDIVRCALDSLALKYRLVLDEIEGILGRRFEPLHVVGGGTRNRLLSQLAADATGRVVEAGPVEATAAGSVVMQAMASGHVGSLPEARDLVRRSFEVERFEPRPSPALDEALAFLRRLIQP